MIGHLLGDVLKLIEGGIQAFHDLLPGTAVIEQIHRVFNVGRREALVHRCIRCGSFRRAGRVPDNTHSVSCDHARPFPLMDQGAGRLVFFLGFAGRFIDSPDLGDVLVAVSIFAETRFELQARALTDERLPVYLSLVLFLSGQIAVAPGFSCLAHGALGVGVQME